MASGSPILTGASPSPALVSHLPRASAALRGQIRTLVGLDDFPDTTYICRKARDGTYGWFIAGSSWDEAGIFDDFQGPDRPIHRSRTRSGHLWIERAAEDRPASIENATLFLTRPPGVTGQAASYPSIQHHAIPDQITATLGFPGTYEDIASSNVTVICGNLNDGWSSSGRFPANMLHLSILPGYLQVETYSQASPLPRLLFQPWTAPFNLAGDPQTVTIEIDQAASSITVSKDGEADVVVTDPTIAPALGRILIWEPYLYSDTQDIVPTIHAVSAR